MEGLTAQNANPFSSAGATPPGGASEIAAMLAGAASSATSTASRAGVDVLGAFNASIAGQLGFGSSLEERQARANEATATNTKQILDEIRNGAGGAVFA